MSEQKRYRLELYFSGRYRDVELSDAMEAPVMIGTTRGCMVRFSRDDFFDDFNLSVSHNAAGEWTVESGNGVYLSNGDLLKLRGLAVHHGDTFTIHYQESGALLCRGQFLREFESSGKSYTRFVELTGVNGLAIGGNPGCQIVVRDEALGSDSIVLQRQGNRWLLAENHTRYGMAVNGVYRTGQKVINDYDFFSLVGHGFFLRGDRLYFETSADVQARGLTVKEHRDSLTRMEYPKLNQSTRVYYKVPEEKIEIQNPPQKEKLQEQSLLATIAPALSMLAITVLLRGVMNGGSTYVIISACTMSVGIITSVYNYLHQNKESEKHEQERVSAYTGYIQRKDGEIQALRQKETALMDINTPDIDATLNSVWRFDGHLYERRIGDEDYLSVRLGTGVVESKCPVKYTAQEFRDESDPMTLWPEQVEQKYHNLPQAPVLVSLAETGTLGIVGSKEAQQSTVRMMTVDLAVHHSHQRLQMAFMFAQKDQDRWEWAKWLRHVNNPVNGCRNLVYDEDSYKNFVEFLYKELCERENLAGRRNVIWPVNYVVFVMEPFELMRHPISKYIASAQDYGVCFVFCDEAEELLPPCQRLIRTQGAAASLIESADGNHVQSYRPQTVQEAQLMRMAVKMACVTIDEVSLAAQLTRNITLYKLLGIYGADDLDLKSRWAKSEVYKSMAAPLGVSLAGVVSLDLHDKAHGPHGLVAGTTGSGKSELLQTYILSIVTLFHPYEVAFVIIDFKGGGMVNQFRGLPHLLGAITNIDGKEIDRSLKSIKAELRTRQQLFANADVNHIDKYIRKYKSGEVRVPLPHLIIIVDEFAELKAEQPEFMKELISAARIGRSLGVHLILATQKPSGQVNEQIWSNSRFKLCLKVQSQSDSNEVLKSPLAAEIKEPGRAYLQVGNDEIFELFQSAYSGAPDKADDLNVREFAINSVTVSGKRTPIYVQKKRKTEEGSMTQLDAIVKYVSDYCEKADIQKLPDICLPSLETCIDFKMPVAEKKDPGRYYVEIGIYDDPDSQYQGGYQVDIGSNNMIIIGSSQTGKTNMLQNIIRSLAVQYTPDEVNIYIIDFASMVLKNFEKLNHVGGVVCPSEDEKLKNLFKLLRTEIDERKEILISVGVSSFTAYREAGRRELPLIVLLIDNLTALKELYFQDDDELLNLCREGLTVGISIIIANAQTTGIGYKYLTNISVRMAMFCNDSSEYSTLFDHCRERLDNIAGRCIIDIEGNHYECQSYLAFQGEKEIDRVKEIRKFISERNHEVKSSFAKKIPVIPASLTKSYIMEEFENYMDSRFFVVAGLDYATVTPYVMDFASVGLLAVTGREQAGRHNWVRYTVDMLDTMYPGQTKIYVVDGISKRMTLVRTSPNVVSYSMLAEDAAVYIREIETQLKDRYDAIVAGNENALDDASLLVLVIDNPDAIAAICAKPDALAAYKNIVGRYKNMMACIITFIENVNIPYSAPEIMKNIRDQKNILFFDDISNMKLFDVPLMTTRRFKKPIETGDGYYIRDNEYVKLKTALSVDEQM